MPVTSTSNPVVKYVRGLARPQSRRSEGVYLAEGVRLVQEAIDTGQRATLVLYDPEALSRTAEGSSLLGQMPTWAERVIEVAPHVLTAAAQTDTPAGVLAVLRLPVPPPLVRHAGSSLGLALDGVADPGNVGTILRSGAAFGASYVLALPGTADFYAPKVVRAGMGAHFRLDLYAHLTWDDVRSDLSDVAAVAADAEGGESVAGVRWPTPCLLIVGSEANGLSVEGREMAQRRVRIPMTAGVESLNAAVAASILLFCAFQRDSIGE